ncbi:hypothetical protein [Streptomyces sp. NPDC012888]|uniref:hypothetical protein n=1 Tax=Streptomyces sp. NPDC012888 TaxID=3364855 RepID=UPI0036891EBA
MESDFSARRALAVAERGAAAPWIDYPPTPRWYCPGAGAWAAALVLALVELRGWWLLLALGALAAVEWAFLLWYRRLRAAWPRTDRAPAEFRPAIRTLLLGGAALTAAVVLLAVSVGSAVAVPLTFAGVTAGLAWYEKAYARAAARTRERVAAGSGA